MKKKSATKEKKGKKTKKKKTERKRKEKKKRNEILQTSPFIGHSFVAVFFIIDYYHWICQQTLRCY